MNSYRDSLLNELKRQLDDINRQVEALQRLDHLASGYLPVDYVRYSGTPTAGQNTYWTGAGTVAGAGTASFTGSAYPVTLDIRTGSATGLQATKGVKYVKSSAAADGDGPRIVFELNDNSTTTQNIVAGIGAARNGADNSADVVIQTANGGVVAEAARVSATGNLTVVGTILSPTITTPAIASFANATHTHTNAAGGGVLSTYAYISGVPTAGQVAEWTGAGTVKGISTVPRYSGVPTAGAIAYWTGAGTVAHASYGTADVTRYSGAPTAGQIAYWTAAGTVAGAGTALFTGASYPVILVTRTGSAAGLQATFGFKYTKSSAAADGDGPRMIFELNDDSTTTQNIVAGIGAARNGADNSADIAIQTGSAGVISEVARFTTGGDFVVGGTAASARIHAIADTLGDTVSRMESPATNDNPIEDLIQGRTATTNATPTTILTVPVPSNTGMGIHAYLIARRTGGSSGTAGTCGYFAAAVGFQNYSGTVTKGSNAVTQFSGPSAWDVGFSVSGTDAILQVTGEANNNITWHVNARVTKVSS